MLCLLCAAVVFESEIDAGAGSAEEKIPISDVVDVDSCNSESLCMLMELDSKDYEDSLSAAVYCQSCVDYLADTTILMKERDRECFQDVLEKRKTHVQIALIKSWTKLQSGDVLAGHYCPWQSVRLRILLELGSVIEIPHYPHPDADADADGENPNILKGDSFRDGDDAENSQHIESHVEGSISPTSTTSGFTPWNDGNLNGRNGAEAERMGRIETAQYYLMEENQSHHEEPMCLVLHNKNQESLFHSQSTREQLHPESEGEHSPPANRNRVPHILHSNCSREASQEPKSENETNQSYSQESFLLDDAHHLVVEEITERAEMNCCRNESRLEAGDADQQQQRERIQLIDADTTCSVVVSQIQLVQNPIIVRESVQSCNEYVNETSLPPSSAIPEDSTQPPTSSSAPSIVAGRKSKRKPLKPTKGIYILNKPTLPERVEVQSNYSTAPVKQSCQILPEPVGQELRTEISKSPHFTERTPPALPPVIPEIPSESSINIAKSPDKNPENFHLPLAEPNLRRNSVPSPSPQKDENNQAITPTLITTFNERITRSKRILQSSSTQISSKKRNNHLRSPTKKKSTSLRFGTNFELESDNEIVLISSLDSPPISPNNIRGTPIIDSHSASLAPAAADAQSEDSGTRTRTRRRRIFLTDKYASYSSEMSKRRRVKGKGDGSEGALTDFGRTNVASVGGSSDEKCSDSDSRKSNNSSSYWLPPPPRRSRSLKERSESTDIENDNVGDSSSKNSLSGRLGRRARLKFVCPQKSCARRFSSEERRDNHFKRMHQGIRNLFSCTNCGKSFPARNRLLTHLKKHELQGKTFPCDQCDKTFPTEKKLYFHLHQHSQNWGLYCDVCGKGFLAGQLARLENHKKIHDESRPRPFQCRDCDRTFSTLQYLKIHRKKHPLQPDEDGLYRCRMEKCMLSFKAVTSFREHLRIHTGELPFECPVCPKKFGYVTAYKKHMISHTDAKEYTCHICGQQFKQKGNLNLHIGRHNGVKPYACKYPGCTYSFFDQYKLKNHMDVHTGRRIFKCGECGTPGKCFRTTTALKAHHAAIHAKERKFKCHCGKTFSQKQYLQFHKTTHPELNLKKFQCDICSKKFTEPSSLREHKRRFHTGETAFSCDTCDYTACFKSRMDKHMLTHSNPQFSCNLCGKQFRQANNLKRHVKSLHT